MKRWQRKTNPRVIATHLADVLRHNRLLDAAQLRQLVDELLPRYAAPCALAEELVRRGWLTAYQVNQLFQGKGNELVLGPYVLLDKLGEGGMGQVFKAKSRKLDHIVALKVIRKERLANDDAVRRFQREMRAVAALHHPNVVHAHFADEVNGTQLLVMEYVEGIDLAKLVQRGPLSVEVACDSVRQAAMALQHAHERGLVHRDVKPANLMVTPGGVVKVLDLGLARLDGEQSSTLTAEGAMLGTPDFIAPEQALEPHTVDIRADLYSLGCTLYFLLTGQVPFPGGTLTDKLLRHQLNQPLPLEQLRLDVPPAVASVVRKLMAKRPGDRYQTPAQLAAALVVAKDECGWPSGEEETVVRGCRTLAREWEETPASALASRVQLAGTTVPDASPGWRGKPSRGPGYSVGVGLVLVASVAAWWLLQKPPAGQAPQDSTPISVPGGILPADEVWRAKVAALPAEQQVEAVAARLKECNPGFDGKVRHTIAGGVVTRLQFTTDNVTDISPVRALTSLRVLHCGGTRGKGKLEDLSPLKGMKLATLACAGTQVSDLSPLVGMKLKELNLWHTPVSDLSPLQGMPLRILGCGGTRVADLSPLKGMKLEELNVWGTPVSDLSPLAGMRLTTLACGATKVSDLTPLQGMMLRTLHCDHTPVHDLSPLGGMKLVCLSCEKTRIADLSPLGGMPLKKLWCDVKVERDKEVLHTLTALETINGKPTVQPRP